MPKNVRERRARHTRSAKPDDDHELGLWIDYDPLRKHQTILYDPSAATNNRYLELADLALGNKKLKKKSKAAASE